MKLEIREVGAEKLDVYATIPIVFEVSSVLRPQLIRDGMGGILLAERPVPHPYRKDYDATGDGPLTWPDDFDVSRWGFLLAYDDEVPVGGAAIAYQTPEVRMLEGRDDLGVLWDIRVAPDHRGRGVGHRIFHRAAEWCRARGCRQMKVETQNVNVTACRFYLRQGCRLGQIHRYAYVNEPDVANEIMLVWYLNL